MTSMPESPRYRRPESVLVVLHTRAGRVLLLKRGDRKNFWQSVTGAMNADEHDPRDTALRELREETGLAIDPAQLRDLKLVQRYPIPVPWRDRYAPGVGDNTEHAFALELADEIPPAIHPEHAEFAWLSFKQAMRKAASWSDRNAIAQAVGRARVPRRERVVLLHGLWMKGWCMVLLAWRLRRAGFDTFCYSYASTRLGLRDNAARLDAWLAEQPLDTIHFVGHSMGGVVIRALFEYFPPRLPGRIVLLGSPYREIASASALSRRRFGPWLLGVSVREFLTGAARDWALPAREIGVVSGTVPLGFGRCTMRLPEPSDGVVTAAETVFPGVSQLVLPVSHSGMLLSRRVAAAIARFLRDGRFESAPVGSGGGR